MNEPMYRFQGYPGYLARVTASDTPEVVGLAQRQDAIADTANLLGQCADADPTHRRAILDAAKLRARAAEIASEVCKAMVADIEANCEFPDAPSRQLLTPGPEAGFRRDAPTKPAVVSEVSFPGAGGEPESRHTLGPDTADRKNPDDGSSQPVTPGGGEGEAHDKAESEAPADDTAPKIVDHREGEEERYVEHTPEPARPKRGHR